MSKYIKHLSNEDEIVKETKTCLYASKIFIWNKLEHFTCNNRQK